MKFHVSLIACVVLICVWINSWLWITQLCAILFHYFLSLILKYLNQLLPALNAIETGTTTVHNYETVSGLRFALYTSNNVPKTSKRQRTSSTSDVISAREVLQHIYAELWVDCVVRSPMYKPQGRVPSGETKDQMGDGLSSAQTATFEKKLDKYLSSLPWFRDGLAY